jgi:hypothetical protein
VWIAAPDGSGLAAGLAVGATDGVAVPTGDDDDVGATDGDDAGERLGVPMADGEWLELAGGVLQAATTITIAAARTWRRWVRGIGWTSGASGRNAASSSRRLTVADVARLSSSRHPRTPVDA